jgi:hypothetical protein
VQDVLDEQRKAVYEQLCISCRAIDDFRANLLGFLPLATGTGVLLLLGNLKPENHQYLPLRASPRGAGGGRKPLTGRCVQLEHGMELGRSMWVF